MLHAQFWCHYARSLRAPSARSEKIYIVVRRNVVRRTFQLGRIEAGGRPKHNSECARPNRSALAMDPYTTAHFTNTNPMLLSEYFKDPQNVPLLQQPKVRFDHVGRSDEGDGAAQKAGGRHSGVSSGHEELLMQNTPLKRFKTLFLSGTNSRSASNSSVSTCFPGFGDPTLSTRNCQLSQFFTKCKSAQPLQI